VNSQPKPSEIIIMVAGLVAFISIFLTWLSFGDVQDYSGFGDFVFPFGTYIGLIGLVMGLQVALARFANVNFPDRVLGFTWPQIHLALAIFAGLLALGFLIQSLPAGIDKGIGQWLGILGAIGLVVGAVMLHLESERATSTPSAPPTPF
jgi:hypothetical protein